MTPTQNTTKPPFRNAARRCGLPAGMPFVGFRLSGLVERIIGRSISAKRQYASRPVDFQISRTVKLFVSRLLLKFTAGAHPKRPQTQAGGIVPLSPHVFISLAASISRGAGTLNPASTSVNLFNSSTMSTS